jgi:hypothetical protein
MNQRSIRVLAALLPVVIVALSARTSVVFATTTTVTDCSNDNQFSSALAGGGTITFNCGVATIVLSSTKTITTYTKVIGGDKITLSGGGARQLFDVKAGGGNLDLVHIVLTKGNNTSNGGAIANAGFLALDYSTIKNSTSSAMGGAVYTTGQSTITGTAFFNNTADSGGAIAATGAAANSVNLSRSLLHDNKSTGTHDVQGTGGGGGAIFADAGAQVYVFSSRIYRNTAAYQGGAIHIQGNGTFVSIAAGTSLLNNNASGNGNQKGGAIFSTASVSLNYVEVTSNISGGPNGLGCGGGIYNYGSATLSNVTMSGNGAYCGAAISNAFSAGMTLTNVTLANNGGTDSSKSSFTAFGGAIDTLASPLTLTNVTITGNRAYTDGGGINDEGDNQGYPSILKLRNVLLKGNTLNCAFSKPPATSVANLSSDGSCKFGAGHDNVTIALGPLETNGGLTRTERLLPGSAAINVGNGVNAPTTDERGIARPQPQAGAFDVGAVEFVPCSGVPTTKPVLVAPAPGATLITTQPSLDWYGPDCATRFKVVVRRGGPNGAVVFRQTVFPSSQVKTSALSHRTAYDWQVKACDAAGCLAGDHWTFKVT